MEMKYIELPKDDGHYVACDKYGNGIGDNIALIQDIRPDLKFAGSCL